MGILDIPQKPGVKLMSTIFSPGNSTFFGWAKFQNFFSNNAESPSIWKEEFNFEKFQKGEEMNKMPILHTPWQELCAPNNCTTYSVSADENYIFGQVTGNKLWRRSTEKQFYVYKLTNGVAEAVHKDAVF